MLSLSEDILFVWEPADLVMSWHAPQFPKWEEKNYSKKPVLVSQKTLISKRGCVMGLANFFKGQDEIYKANRKLHKCIIMNNLKNASED